MEAAWIEARRTFLILRARLYCLASKSARIVQVPDRLPPIGFSSLQLVKHSHITSHFITRCRRKGLQRRIKGPCPEDWLTLNIMHESGMTKTCLLSYAKEGHLLKSVNLTCRTAKIIADLITVLSLPILARSRRHYYGIESGFNSSSIITRAVLRILEHGSLS